MVCPDASYAKLVLVGNSNDISDFCFLLHRGQIQSNTLKVLVYEVEAYSKTIVINLARDNDVFVAAHERIYLNDLQIGYDKTGNEILKGIQCNAFTIDLDDLNKFPIAIRDHITGDISISDGAPIWAITQIGIIAHELAEALDGFRNGWNPQNHAKGIEKENEVRTEFKQIGQRGADMDDIYNGQPVRIIKIEIGINKNKVILVRDSKIAGRLAEIKYE